LAEPLTIDIRLRLISSILTRCKEAFAAADWANFVPPALPVTA